MLQKFIKNANIFGILKETTKKTSTRINNFAKLEFEKL